jgi:hypothetical protein
MRRFALVGGAALILALSGSNSAQAQRPEHQLSGHHTFERAGYHPPFDFSKRAAPTVTDKYGIGYVGGAKLFRGEPRYDWEGTFGWDYFGCRHRYGRLFLGWAHGARVYPANFGYATDTIHVPDPIAKRLIDVAEHGPRVAPSPYRTKIHYQQPFDPHNRTLP